MFPFYHYRLLKYCWVWLVFSKKEKKTTPHHTQQNKRHHLHKMFGSWLLFPVSKRFPPTAFIQSQGKKKKNHHPTTPLQNSPLPRRGQPAISSLQPRTQKLVWLRKRSHTVPKDTRCVPPPQVTIFCYVEGAAPCLKRVAAAPSARAREEGWKNLEELRHCHRKRCRSLPKDVALLYG